MTWQQVRLRVLLVLVLLILSCEGFSLAALRLQRGIRFNNHNGESVEGELVSQDSNSTISIVKKSDAKALKSLTAPLGRKKLDLMFCGPDSCRDTNRERVIHDNQIVLTGPATGQVAYEWNRDEDADATVETSGKASGDDLPVVLFLVRQGDTDLLQVAADAIQELPQIRVLLDPSTAARLGHNHGVDHDNICLWEPSPTPGFGSDLHGVVPESVLPQNDEVDLIVTIGGDGLLLHTAMMFPGPMPPILSVSGGSLGFLTPFTRDEMVDAILIAVDIHNAHDESLEDDDPEERGQNNSKKDSDELAVFPPNMPTYPYAPLGSGKGRTIFNSGPRICLSIRMRLECRIVNRHGAVRARYNVLNEVVIDRGSSSYLASLECFCDDVHLTTVQADGIIFATPTGSTAYSMAAGGSVVHPSVPAILVTPICPHVLSFRSMIFPDHCVLRCLVPDDARATASVALDGAQRRHELHRGDYVLVAASNYPVPTINRADHSADWLGSLKENFHFNTRRRQRPL